MLYRSTNSALQRPTRKGVVLLVVITLLALFAAVGLSFVYYAEAQANASRVSAQAQTANFIDVEPEMLLAYALGQLVFDTDDIAGNGYNNNVYSALRGIGLARNMYGYNRNTLNVTPFNGLGRANTGTDPSLGLPVQFLPNHTYFPGDGFVRDPGRNTMVNRKNPSLNYDPSSVYVGDNVPWTYADLENFYLGQSKADGTILARSFYREWTASNLPGVFKPLTLDPDDAVKYAKFWGPTVDPTIHPLLKYMTLRPLPCYNYIDPATGKALFPGPEDGGGDVRNREFGLGVPNPNQPGKYYNNDSIWIDLGFPVRVGPDGRKYRPLFAFYIEDLDGKVNINAAGNVRLFDGTINGHGSNKGLTPTEINLAKILASTTTPLEWQKVLAYRYGADGRPGIAGSSWSSGSASSSPWYGLYDVDSAKNDPMTNDATRLVSEKILFPGDGNIQTLYGQTTNYSTVPFPFLPPNTYQNGNALELRELPWLYNYFNPTSAPSGTSDDRAFNIRQMEALLRYSGTSSPNYTTDLFSSLPQNLNDPANDPNKRRWRMFTLHSVDLARPGITPWLFNSAGTGTDYQYALGTSAPTGNPKPLPQPIGGAPNANTPSSPANGEYGADFRGMATKTATPGWTFTSASRFNLQTPVWDPTIAPNGAWRSLKDYPLADPATGRLDLTNAANATQYQLANTDRQQFAKNLFDRLRFVTTGARPTDTFASMGATIGSPKYDALRWLAQLSVNIVDAIDSDNIMTTFVFDPANPGLAPGSPNYPDGFVVGTEQQRLTINEGYAEIINDPTDPFTGNMPTLDYKVNFWVELINPLLKVPDPATNTLNDARLMVADGATKGWPVYKLAILNAPTDPGLRQLPASVSNCIGQPTPALVKRDVDNYDPNGTPTAEQAVTFHVQPVDQNPNDPGKTNVGFYVLGPQDADVVPGGMMPFITPTLKVFNTTAMGGNSAMTYAFDKGLSLKNDLKNQTLLLRRLANPGLPPDPNPASPTFNPYVTIDYLENLPINDNVTKDSMGDHTKGDPAGFYRSNPVRQSAGKKQPFAAQAKVDALGIEYDPALSQILPQNGATVPQNTFFSHNNPLTPTFDWLAFYDRMLTSPIELLNVSGYRPHELTQQFIWNTTKHSHLVNWTDPANRLYRFLEYVDSGWRNLNVTQDGRIPGKININTIWDPEIFQALCDQNTAVNFTAADVQTIFTQLLQSRSPQNANNRIDQTDKPFRGLAAPYTAPGTDGVDATILRNVGGAPLFQPASAAAPGTHPTQKLELLNKIFNNVTTRSNVFAVWMTVGFFEAYPTATPGSYLLGKEIGKDENRNIRHRMFSIIDRTAVVMPKNLATAQIAITAGAAPQTILVDRLTSSLPAPFRVDFSLQPGMQVEIDSGAGNAEVVTIISTTTTPQPITITAVFGQNHAAGAVFSVPAAQAVDSPTPGMIYGNPGPQPHFDHRLNSFLVPHYSIIQ